MRYLLLLLTLLLEAAALLLPFSCGVVNVAFLASAFSSPLQETTSVQTQQYYEAATALGLSHVVFVLQIYAVVVVIRLLWPFLDLLRLGTRRPTQQEAAYLQSIFHQIQARGAARSLRVKTVRFVRVRDTLFLNASWVGACLVLDRGLLSSPYFPALLARELAHNNSADLATIFIQRLLAPLGCCFGYFVGLGAGLGPLLTWPLWRLFWRNRVYAADTFAAALGYRWPLIEALERLYLPMDAATRYGIFARDKPYIALRIDKLRQGP